jgi:hypothetical protein
VGEGGDLGKEMQLRAMQQKHQHISMSCSGSIGGGALTVIILSGTRMKGGGAFRHGRTWERNPRTSSRYPLSMIHLVVVL